jgi:hypothetical protein
MRIALLACCLTAVVLPARAGAPLSMRVSPAVALAPAFVRVETMVERNADNRSLLIIAESPDFYSRSEVPLNGASSPRLQTFDFPHLGSGLYQVTGVLIGTGGTRASTVRLMRIAPGAGSGR